MTIKYSTTLRNNRLNILDGAFNSGKLRIYSGAPPASVDDAATGTMLVELSLPSTAMAPASGGTKSKAGTWSGVAAASGNAGYFRLIDTTFNFATIQGTVGLAGSSPDLIVDAVAISNGQAFSVTSFTITAGQA